MNECSQLGVYYDENELVHNHLYKHKLQIRHMVGKLRHGDAITIAHSSDRKHKQIHGMII